jgi:hypothetical protein
MTAADSGFNWLKLRPFVTPIALLAASGVLAYAASELSYNIAGSFTKISWFAAVAIVTLHLTFYVCRWATDDVSLKLVDYIYLIIALGSIGAVLDVQVAGMKSESLDFLPKSIERLEKLYQQCLKNPDASSHAVGCEWQDQTLEYMRGGAYNHLVVGSKLQSYDRDKASLSELHGPFFEVVRRTWESMELLGKEFGTPVDQHFMWWKLFFIYMFCVGAVIRLCKVTTELFNWRVPKKTDWDW